MWQSFIAIFHSNYITKSGKVWSLSTILMVPEYDETGGVQSGVQLGGGAGGSRPQSQKSYYSAIINIHVAPSQNYTVAPLGAIFIHYLHILHS